jgi:hypothetical protein
VLICYSFSPSTVHHRHQQGIRHNIDGTLELLLPFKPLVPHFASDRLLTCTSFRLFYRRYRSRKYPNCSSDERLLRKHRQPFVLPILRFFASISIRYSSDYFLYLTLATAGVLGLSAHAVTLMLLATQFMTWRGVGNPQVYIVRLSFLLYSTLPVFFT